MQERLDFNGPDDPRITEIEARHGHSIPREGYYKVVDLAPQNMIPTSQSFGGANGGEYRKSFHGYAPGFAQVIDSPEEFQVCHTQSEFSTHALGTCVQLDVLGVYFSKTR